FERPLDATDDWKSWWDDFIPPLVLALLIVLFFHLWIWGAALRKNFPRWFGSRSKLVLFVIFSSLIIGTMMTGAWAITSFLVLCLSIIYSQRRLLPLIGAILFALYFTLKPFVAAIASTMVIFSAQEAIDLGRTRIEYPPAALDNLTSTEKSIWSDYNGDLRAANYWLEQAESSKEKAILSVNLSANYSTPADLLLSYENLQKTYGDDPTILFNLSQLYIRTQQLIQADQVRAKINGDFYNEASSKAALINRLLIPPPTRSRLSPMTDSISKSFQNILASSGLLPFSPFKGGLSLLVWFLPWLLILLALLRRSKAAGVCIQTGEPTPSPDESLSALYQSVIMKKDATNHTIRQQLDILVRRFSQIQIAQIKTWMWVFCGSSSLVLDQSIGLAYVKTAVPLLFLWNAFSVSFRAHLLHFFHSSPENYFSSSNFSLGFLILFLASYLLFLSQNLSRSAA
ncbi:MAG: hypothetical protein JWQ35_1345, partial [Bacteriovoracaceae bacterium]|nr:hypothetical protein [Bacteriovoracaceae bacterium]